MQTAKNILSITLVFAMLASGLPLFTPEDANRDSRIDIKDAILSVRGLAQTADNPATFTANFENAVSSLEVLAGLKTIISSAGDAKSTPASPSLVPPYLISSFDFSFIPVAYSKTAVQFFYYQSILSSPASPPPQDSSIC